MCLLPVYVALACVAISFAQQPISIDDGDPSIVYEPAGAWMSAPVFGAQLYNNSATFSQTPGATATWKFKGSLLIGLSCRATDLRGAGTHVEYWGMSRCDYGVFSLRTRLIQCVQWARVMSGDDRRQQRLRDSRKHRHQRVSSYAVPAQ